MAERRLAIVSRNAQGSPSAPSWAAHLLRTSPVGDVFALKHIVRLHDLIEPPASLVSTHALISCRIYLEMSERENIYSMASIESYSFLSLILLSTNIDMPEQNTVVLSTRLRKRLADRFLRMIERHGYLNVSEALRDLIRAYLEEEEMKDGNA